MTSTRFVGRPVIPGDMLLADDYTINTSPLVLGVTTPNRGSAGSIWYKFGAWTASNLGAYGQFNNPVVGEWMEWDVFVPGFNPDFPLWHFWSSFMKGPNIGTVDIKVDGVSIGPFDGYAAAYASQGVYKSVSIVPGLENFGKTPGKHTVRMQVINKNASSTANYILLNSFQFYRVSV